jgi:hypothetical protein
VRTFPRPVSFISSSNSRPVSALLLGLWLALQGACSDDDKSSPADAGSDAAVGASCEPGRSVACTGRGGCAGFQVCGDDGRYGSCDCSGATGGGGSDGGTVTQMTAACGAACTSDADCGGGSCVVERTATGEVDGLGTLTQTRFPGGICSQVPLTPATSAAACDPTLPVAQQGCGDCGVCVYEVIGGTVASVCRERCEPSATDNGCSRDEYTCSFSTGACSDGQCQNDDDCRIYPIDGDGDGATDGLTYDAASKATCNLDTRRCTAPGKAGAQAGDPCLRDDDCEADGFCITENSGQFELPFAGGYCVKRGCEVPGLACAGDGVCSDSRALVPGEELGTACVQKCQGGTEAPADQLGAAGHGQGCRPGYMCLWDGLDSTDGTCLPGNYNTVASANLGATCESDADCYSPFGHGRCAVFGSDTASAAFCTIFDCGTPGLPEDLCGANGLCVADTSLSACVPRCTDASECGPSIACVGLRGGSKACLFGCSDSTECKAGETCNTASGACEKR